MERTSLPGLAAPDAGRPAATRLRRLRLQLEPLALTRLSALAAGAALTLAATAVASAVYVSESLTRHREFQSNAYDLGFFDQIIWNTAHGRFFETTFVSYNFLGQHFDPILLLLAGIYRLGAGIESLLIIQALMVALAAVPLYFAAVKLTHSAQVGVMAAAAYLLSAPIHQAVSFDFHPETGAFFFLFTAVCCLAYQRAMPAALAALPLLTLKEDMALVVIAFAGVMALRGYRREAKWLGVAAITWFAATVLVIMPLIRGGGSDLTRRYGYLVEDSNPWEILPMALERAISHLAEAALPGLLDLLLSVGFLPLLSVVGLVAAGPAILLNGLSDHPQQAGLELHYGVAALALLWLATLLGLEVLSRREGRLGGLLGARLREAWCVVLLISAFSGFLTSSPFAPGDSIPRLSGEHRAALEEALSMISADASVEAQSAILPHVSRRQRVYEFPDRRLPLTGFVIVDSGLPVSEQSLRVGYHDRLERLPSRGYAKVFEREGVQVWRRSQ